MAIDKKYIASFDVDAQKGFSELCPAELPVPGALEIVNELNKQALFAAYRVGSKDAHPAWAMWNADGDHPPFSPVGLPNVDIHWPSHCVTGSTGCELLDGLPDVTEYDFFVWKGCEPNLHPYGACFHDLFNKLSTGVIEFLFSKGIKLVIVGGLATNYCVATTSEQLVSAGFRVVINLAACRGIGDTAVEDTKKRFAGKNVRFIDKITGLAPILDGRVLWEE